MHAHGRLQELGRITCNVSSISLSLLKDPKIMFGIYVLIIIRKELARFTSETRPKSI
jgi:hypothetical protein